YRVTPLRRAGLRREGGGSQKGRAHDYSPIIGRRGQRHSGVQFGEDCALAHAPYIFLNLKACTMTSPTLMTDAEAIPHTPPLPFADNPVIEPRQAVAALSAYKPPIEGRRDFIRLDFNENTLGYPNALSADLPGNLINTYP